MTTKATSNRIFKLLFLSIFIIACETDDINPAIFLSSDSMSFSEADGSVTITATLDQNTTQEVIIPLIFSGSSILNSDFSTSANEIIIATGTLSGSITLTSIQDIDLEETETIMITQGNVPNYLAANSLTIEFLDDETDSDDDGIPDVIDNCPNIPGLLEFKGCQELGFLINEVNYDPASGDAGDANGDGTRSALEDEFIEFLNIGPELDISGYTISDASQVRHTFPPGTVLPTNGVLVLFGGGTPTGSFGGATVQTASSGQLNMSNAGDLVTLADASGNTVLTFDITPLSGNPNESYTRNPDLTGEFEQHAGVAEANGALYSPGTKLDGTNF